MMCPATSCSTCAGPARSRTFGRACAAQSCSTNLDTGGTFTIVFTTNTRDHTIVDNGDGTVTITSFASGGYRAYDQDDNLVLKDPGQLRFAIDIDFNGTPGNPDDDVEVPDSFRIVRPSTGRNDTEGRDFCADLVTFTS
ncbi:MAG: hypothetical protein WKF73_05275 [Nocardioidaceae bacterium]